MATAKSDKYIEIIALAWYGDDGQIRLTTNDPDVLSAEGGKGFHIRIKRGGKSEVNLRAALATHGVEPSSQ